MRRTVALVLLGCGLQSAALAASSCVPVDDAAKKLNKDICLSAHVYDVVELRDGTRFLDICSPEVSDDRCRFTIVSPAGNRETVGDLRKYSNTDVHLRGTVERMHGRLGIVLSHSRQFSGGPPKFRPNPRLLRGFSGEQEKPPIADPNLRPQGGRRAFMNTREKENLPMK